MAGIINSGIIIGVLYWDPAYADYKVFNYSSSNTLPINQENFENLLGYGLKSAINSLTLSFSKVFNMINTKNILPLFYDNNKNDIDKILKNFRIAENKIDLSDIFVTIFSTSYAQYGKELAIKSLGNNAIKEMIWTILNENVQNNFKISGVYTLGIIIYLYAKNEPWYFMLLLTTRSAGQLFDRSINEALSMYGTSEQSFYTWLAEGSRIIPLGITLVFYHFPNFAAHHRLWCIITQIVIYALPATFNLLGSYSPLLAAYNKSPLTFYIPRPLAAG